MSTPTELEIRAQWRAIVDLLEEDREHGDDVLVSKIDTIVQALETPFAEQITAALAIYRGRYSDLLSTGVSPLVWILRTYGDFLESPATDPQQLLDVIFKHFAEYEGDVIGPDSTGTGFEFAATVITRNDGGDWTTSFSVGDYVTSANTEDVGNTGTFGPITAVSASDLTIATAAFTVNADDTTATFRRTAIRVASRDMTLGTPMADAGNAASTGSIHRLKVDAYGYQFEHGDTDTKTATVDTDASSGADIHEEQILIEGDTASRDLLEQHSKGSGESARLTGLTHRNANTLQNAGFEQVTTATAVSAGAPQPLTAAPTGWTLLSGTIGNVYATTDVYYRQLVGVTTPIALEFRGNASFRQKLSVNRVALQPATPYLCGVAMRCNAALSAGTMTLALGSQSVAKDLTTLTDNTWSFVPITLGTGSWFKNFNATDLAVTLTLASLAGAGGYAYADEVILAPGTFFDGSWYWAIGGTVAWLKGEFFAWSDSEASPLEGKIQRQVKRHFGRYLPHHGTTPTFLDP